MRIFIKKGTTARIKKKAEHGGFIRIEVLATNAFETLVPEPERSGYDELIPREIRWVKLASPDGTDLLDIDKSLMDELEKTSKRLDVPVDHIVRIALDRFIPKASQHSK